MTTKIGSALRQRLGLFWADVRAEMDAVDLAVAVFIFAALIGAVLLTLQQAAENATGAAATLLGTVGVIIIALWVRSLYKHQKD